MDSKSHFEFVDIDLDGNKNRFKSGDDVCGVIRFALKGSAIVANIKICLICVSEVLWTENPGTRYHRSGHVYHDKTRLVNQRYALPKKYECLSEGEHEVPFKFHLPEKFIPSSFTGPHGSIKYYIEVINEEPGVEEGHRVGLHEFGVDAISHDNLSLSIGCSKEKELGALNLASGKLILYASFSKKGWVPGELLELHVTVDNQSSIEAAPRATLYQTQVYMCGERHKAVEIPLTDPIVGKKVDKNQNFTETLFISTPKDMSLTIKSPLISVKYFVHVTLDIPHAFDIHINVPVVITSQSVPSAD